MPYPSDAGTVLIELSLGLIQRESLECQDFLTHAGICDWKVTMKNKVPEVLCPDDTL